MNRHFPKKEMVNIFKSSTSWTLLQRLSLNFVILCRITGVLSLSLWSPPSALHYPSYIQTPGHQHCSSRLIQRTYNRSNVNRRRESIRCYCSLIKDSDPEEVSNPKIPTFRDLLQSITHSVTCISLVGLLMSSTACTAQELLQDPSINLSPNHLYQTSTLVAQSETSEHKNSQQINSVNPSSTVLNWDQIKLSLPTDEHPRIQINPSQRIDSDMKKNRRLAGKEENSPLAQGLVYISNQRDLFEEYRRDPSQILVLTLSTSQSNSVIAGAQIPLMQISRFPIQVQLGEGNIRPSLSKEERRALKRQDFKVSASICSSSMETTQEKQIPCQDPTQVSFQATGYAKLLSGDLFGLDNMEETIRAPFSLALSAVFE